MVLNTEQHGVDMTEEQKAANNNHRELLKVWPVIKPLPEVTLLPVEPFDMALLPEALRPFAADITERMQCPPDFVAVTIMAALGVVIGRRVGVRPKQHDDWTEYTNQWACIVGRPGVMKSPAMAAALAPLHQLQASADKMYASELRVYESDKCIHELRQEADHKRIKETLKKNPAASITQGEFSEPCEPVLHRYLLNDSTVEALLDISIENPQGVGLFRDELVSLLKSLDRDGQESSRGFFLTGWNGNSGYTMDRIARGRNLRAEAVCLSLIGSTQPGRIAEYLRDAITDSAANDGLIQRFGLLVWPDVSAAWEDVDQFPDSAHKQRAFAVFRSLDEANPVTDWGAEIVVGHDGSPEASSPPYLRLDAAALAVFREWRVGWEAYIRSGQLHPALEGHFAKYRKLIPSLALICHLADGGLGPITIQAMVRALAWCDYLKSHALRAYGCGTIAPVDRARALLKKIREGKLPAQPFPLKAVYRNQWTLLTDQAQAVEAVSILIDHGYLIEIQEDDTAKDGRPREPRYVVNPESV